MMELAEKTVVDIDVSTDGAVRLRRPLIHHYPQSWALNQQKLLLQSALNEFNV